MGLSSAPSPAGACSQCSKSVSPTASAVAARSPPRPRLQHGVKHSFLRGRLEPSRGTGFGHSLMVNSWLKAPAPFKHLQDLYVGCKLLQVVKLESLI